MLKRNKKKQAVVNVDFKQNILNEESHFSINEAYKATRTNIMFTLAGVEGCKKIMTVSTEAGEGKSTTTINLAISFAQTGAKVLIIEADLRRPALHRYLNLSKDNGLSEYLGGFTKDAKEIIQHVPGYENLDCITGGHIPPNPSELLLSKSMEKLLDIQAEDYDYIFIDTPPLNHVADAASIAKMMTGTIVVVRQNRITTDALNYAISSLEFSQARILGYIFNGVAATETKSYYRSKYIYQYSQKN